jgi:hypothetical protein
MKDKKMNKGILILIPIVILVGCLVIFLLLNKDTKTGYVTLETHANEIYEWKYEIDNKDIVKFVEKKQSGDLEGKTPEGKIIEKYYFEGKKPGKTDISFTFTNTKNGSYLDTKYYTVTVDKKLKLTIEEKKQ